MNANRSDSFSSDADASLSEALFHTFTNDARILRDSTLPEIVPILEDEKLRNPAVSGILCFLAQHTAPQLVGRGKIHIIVKALR